MKSVYTLILTGLLFCSCQKRYELGSLDSFDVRTEKQDYAPGDTVRFLISGHPDNIVFWSGESGSNYEYRKRTFVEGNTILLNFKSYSQYGVADQSSLKVLVSTDFSGIYDSAHVKSATWTDITDRVVLSSGQDQTPSGDINLNDFASLNKNMAIAFQYKTTVVKTSATQNRWVIRSFDLKSVNSSGAENIFTNMAGAGWKSFNFSGAESVWSISSSQLISGRNFTELDDDWVVTKQFNPNSVEPDKGTAIKNISQRISEYSAVYNKAGTYKVVFVATNGNVKHDKSVIKEMELHIRAK